MAKVELLASIIFGWEGTWANDPIDKGGATNMGVTLDTWKSCGYDKDGDSDIDVDDLKLITKQDVVNKILKPHYWDRWKADQLKSQGVANILVDFVWASGAWGIKKPQKMLGLIPDGLVGNATLTSVNDYVTQEKLFNKLKQIRIEFVNNIVNSSIIAYEKIIGRKATPDELLKNTQLKFKKGWTNRINSFKYY